MKLSWIFGMLAVGALAQDLSLSDIEKAKGAESCMGM